MSRAENKNPETGAEKEPVEPGESVGNTDSQEQQLTALPWDTPGLNPFIAFKDTLLAVLLRPLDTFHRVSASEDRWPALGYALLMHVLGFGMGALWLAVLEPAELTLGLIRVVIAPLWVLVSIWGGSELMHGILGLLRGTRYPRSVTHRAVAYCYSTAIFGVIPGWGLRIGLLAAVVYQIMALREAHRAPTWKAALAVILTWGLVIGVVVVMAVSSAPLDSQPPQ